MGIDILGTDSMGVDILGVDIPAPTLQNINVKIKIPFRHFCLQGVPEKNETHFQFIITLKLFNP